MQWDKCKNVKIKKPFNSFEAAKTEQFLHRQQSTESQFNVFSIKKSFYVMKENYSSYTL